MKKLVNWFERFEEGIPRSPDRIKVFLISNLIFSLSLPLGFVAYVLHADIFSLIDPKTSREALVLFLVLAAGALMSSALSYFLLFETVKGLKKVNDKHKKLITKSHSFIVNMLVTLRRPLHGIMAVTQLADLEDDAEVGPEQLHVVGECAEQMLGHLEKMQYYSEVQADMVRYQTEECHLQNEIHEIAKPYEKAIKERGLQWRVAVDEGVSDSLRVHTDAVKIILDGLLDNALKHTATGLIQVRVKENPENSGELLFQVRDTGLGISAKKKLEIMTQHEAHGNEMLLYHQSGIGLPTVKMVLQKVGGRLWLESELGFGTSFYFTIPYAHSSFAARFEQNKVAHGMKKEAAESLAPAKKPTEVVAPAADEDRVAEVLIVDDEEFSRFLLQRMLRKLGTIADVAKNGFEAVEKAKKGNYKLIFMDVQMPEMDGWEATQKIFEACGLERPRIVATTSHARMQDIQYSESIGMDSFISKPIKLDAVQRCLAEAGVATGEELPEHVEAAMNEKRHGEEGGQDRLVQYLLRASREKSQPLVKFDAMLRFYETNIRLCLKALERASDAIPSLMADIKAAEQSSDLTRLAIDVHKLKGEFGYICCEKGQSYCESAYKELQNQSQLDPQKAKEITAHLDQLVMDLLDELESYTQASRISASA